jgi:hypothetical protein
MRQNVQITKAIIYDYVQTSLIQLFHSSSLYWYFWKSVITSHLAQWIRTRNQWSKCSKMPNLYDFVFNGVISVTNAELRGKKWNSLNLKLQKNSKLFSPILFVICKWLAKTKSCPLIRNGFRSASWEDMWSCSSLKKSTAGQRTRWQRLMRPTTPGHTACWSSVFEALVCELWRSSFGNCQICCVFYVRRSCARRGCLLCTVHFVSTSRRICR